VRDVRTTGENTRFDPDIKWRRKVLHIVSSRRRKPRFLNRIVVDWKRQLNAQSKCMKGTQVVNLRLGVVRRVPLMNSICE
jgi:hypothetical protein